MLSYTLLLGSGNENFTLCNRTVDSKLHVKSNARFHIYTIVIHYVMQTIQIMYAYYLCNTITISNRMHVPVSGQFQNSRIIQHYIVYRFYTLFTNKQQLSCHTVSKAMSEVDSLHIFEIYNNEYY